MGFFQTQDSDLTRKSKFQTHSRLITHSVCTVFYGLETRTQTHIELFLLTFCIPGTLALRSSWKWLGNSHENLDTRQNYKYLLEDGKFLPEWNKWNIPMYPAEDGLCHAAKNSHNDATTTYKGRIPPFGINYKILAIFSKICF